MNKQNIRKEYISKMTHNGGLEVVEPGSPGNQSPQSRPSSSKRAPPPHGSKHGSAIVNGKALPTIEKSLVTVKRKESQSKLSSDLNNLQLNSEDDEDIIAMANLDGASALSGITNKVQAKSSQANSSNNNNNADSDTDDSSGEDEELKAPNELIMEFLQCVMTDDIENGLKLCKMILLYEPNNSRALNFLPVLEEKLAQDKRNEEESDSDDDDDSDDDNEDSDDDEDDYDGSDDDSEEESSSDEEDDTIQANNPAAPPGGDNHAAR